MARLRRLMLLTFIDSFGSGCTQMGMLFLAEDVLKFSGAWNLWLAACFGAGYIGGSLCCHAVSQRLGEKRLLACVLWAQGLLCVAMAAHLTPAVVFAGLAILGVLNGLKWPVVESYVSARRSALLTARAIGRFNVSWSLAGPLALIPSGAIIAWWPAGLPVLAAALSAVCLWLIRPLPGRVNRRPQRREGGGAGELGRCRALLILSRWQLLCSYALLWVLAALMPPIFKRLGFDVTAGTVMAAVLGLVRVAGFVLLERTPVWHDRLFPVAVTLVCLPAGFFLVVLAPSAAVALCGEALFGLSASMVYYAALYYGMVATNASVAAGGIHESLIAVGFVIGPVSVIVGRGMGPMVGGPGAGTLIGIAPVLLLCAAGALVSIARVRMLPRAKRD